jgi:hypothetical protein
LCPLEFNLFKILKVPSLKKYVIEFGENVFSTDGNILFCKICETKVNGSKRFTALKKKQT